MSGMYPDNRDTEIFGEQVSWPGVDAGGKFTNGSFNDPMVKPSFIPAETVNLILDNLESVIRKCGETPNATGVTQIAGLITSLAQSETIIMRDEHGRAKVAAPQAEDDIARLAEIIAAMDGVVALLNKTANSITPNGFGLYSPGRDLKAVLGVSTIPQAMAALQVRCNGTGVPNFSGLQIGDYLDGLNLSAIPAERGGTAGQAWNDTYKNNRIALAAFNPYKGTGDVEAFENHIRFDFVNSPIKGRMNANNNNSGGYQATEMRAFLDGIDGCGNGNMPGVATAAFLNALKNQIGNCILPIRRKFSFKNGSNWITYSLWLPSENEVYGESTFGENDFGDGQKLHIPLYRDSLLYRVKRYNGSRILCFSSSHVKNSSGNFCGFDAGFVNYANAGDVFGCAPAFCVAKSPSSFIPPVEK